jgi:hypothetical protein
MTLMTAEAKGDRDSVRRLGRQAGRGPSICERFG